jgi:hypothetical protein
MGSDLLNTYLLRQFHPIIFAIATSETGVDFGMFFKAWQDFSDPPLTPAFAMSDSVEAIPNGAREVWGDILRNIAA